MLRGWHISEPIWASSSKAEDYARALARNTGRIQTATHQPRPALAIADYGLQSVVYHV
jgi:hypothetical protein